MTVQVRHTKKCGLEVYQVWVGGVLAHEFMSLPHANTKAMKYCRAFGVEMLK